jgi:hypothetical protein
VHLVILCLSTCVDRIATLPFSGPGHGPTAVRQVAVPNAPLLGIDVSIGEFRGDPAQILGCVSWIALEGLKAEVAGGRPLGWAFHTLLLVLEVPPTAHCLSSTTNSTDQAHAVLHPSTYWVTHYLGAACSRAL